MWLRRKTSIRPEILAVPVGIEENCRIRRFYGRICQAKVGNKLRSRRPGPLQVPLLEYYSLPCSSTLYRSANVLQKPDLQFATTGQASIYVTGSAIQRRVFGVPASTAATFSHQGTTDSLRIRYTCVQINSILLRTFQNTCDIAEAGNPHSTCLVCYEYATVILDHKPASCKSEGALPRNGAHESELAISPFRQRLAAKAMKGCAIHAWLST